LWLFYIDEGMAKMVIYSLYISILGGKKFWEILEQITEEKTVRD